MGYFQFQQLLSHKFLFAFSLFCALFSLVPLLFHSLKAFLMQYTIEKSYIFVLCNGLLGFIAMYSGLTNVSSPSTCDYDDESIEYAVDKNIRLHYNVSESDITAQIACENVMEVESSPEEDDEKSLMVYLEPEDVVSDAKEDEEEEEGNANALMMIDANGDGDDQSAADDTEELNKKCEDFIKKMRAGFCSEHRAYGNLCFVNNQNSLVVVN